MSSVHERERDGCGRAAWITAEDEELCEESSVKWVWNVGSRVLEKELMQQGGGTRVGTSSSKREKSLGGWKQERGPLRPRHKVCG